MSRQALDLKRSAQIVWRYRALVGAAALLGLLAAAAFTALYPPAYTSTALVAFPPSVSISTQAVVVTSTPVLSLALPSVPPGTSVDGLRGRVDAEQAAAGLMSVNARARTSAQAIDTANAVARSYVAYVTAAGNPVGQVSAQFFRPATTVTGTSLTRRLYDAVAPCVVGGALIGAIIALALGRDDRRLRDRDEIADSIGVPVLASVRLRHPSGAADWAKLLGGSVPEADAWQLRRALRQLAAVGQEPGEYPGPGSSIAVLSLSSDRHALALGPQLAVAAAALGIPTALVIGPQQDAKTTAALHAACAAGSQPRGPRDLRVAVSDHRDAGQLPCRCADRGRRGRGRPDSQGRRHHAHDHYRARGQVRLGDGPATGPRHGQRRRRRPRDRRDPRGGSRPGRPDDRPSAAFGTNGAKQDANARDGAVTEIKR